MNEFILSIDNQLNKFLQKNIILELNNKTIKNGKFLLYTHNFFNFCLIIKNKSKDKPQSVRIPYPFEIKIEKDILIFSYKMADFHKNITEVEQIFSSVEPEKISKYYNNILKIKFF